MTASKLDKISILALVAFDLEQKENIHVLRHTYYLSGHCKRLILNDN